MSKPNGLTLLFARTWRVGDAVFIDHRMPWMRLWHRSGLYRKLLARRRVAFKVAADK